MLVTKPSLGTLGSSCGHSDAPISRNRTAWAAQVDAGRVASGATGYRPAVRPTYRELNPQLYGDARMSKLKIFAVHARSRAVWLVLLAIPLFVAACNNSGGGTGY
jgi:hypothetical protein